MEQWEQNRLESQQELRNLRAFEPFYIPKLGSLDRSRGELGFNQTEFRLADDTITLDDREMVGGHRQLAETVRSRGYMTLPELGREIWYRIQAKKSRDQ